ncbi:MAG TPA: hypothetical protein VF240_06590 [Pyrinomonadaceae bacterium]
MKRTLHVAMLALAVASAALASDALAQNKQTRSQNNNTPAGAQPALPTLPASDAVVLVELRRLISEELPRALASDAPRLAAVNADIDAFKTRTGIDPRAFDTLAAGSRFMSLAGGKTKLTHTVAVARGTFDMAAIVAALRASSKGNHREQKHAGKSVHVFTLNEEVKLFGLLGVRVRDLAVAELDRTTLAVGHPAAVLAAIDAARGRGALRASDLTVLTQPRAASTLVAFGGKVSATAFKDIDVGTPEISRSVASIREFYGALSTTAGGYGMQTTLRTTGAADAKSLGDTIGALKQLAPLFIGRLSGDRQRLAQSAVESLQVSAQGNEVRLSLEIAQGDITTLVRTF